LKFPTPETAPAAERITNAEWRVGDKRGTISEFKPEDKSRVARGRVSADGVAVVTAEFTPKEIQLTSEEVSEYLEEIAAPAGVRQAYEQDGVKAGWHETFTKHAKTYLRIGSGGDASGALGPVGLAIDFLPARTPPA